MDRVRRITALFFEEIMLPVTVIGLTVVFTAICMVAALKIVRGEVEINPGTRTPTEQRIKACLESGAEVVIPRAETADILCRKSP